MPRSHVGFGRGGLAEDGSRQYGADIFIRRTHRGRFILVRLRRTPAGRLTRTVIWRSSRDYYNTGGDNAFGPHLFAFDDYYHGIFLTDLRHPERLVMQGRGLYPIGFTRGGELLVSLPGHSIAAIASDGRLLRRYSYRRGNAFSWDDHTGTLYFVQPDGMLTAAHGAHLHRIRRLSGIEGQIWQTPPRLLVFTAPRSVTITDMAGTIIARDRWPHTPIDNFDSGLSVSPNGRSFAFRLSSAHPGASHGEAVVYVLRAGESRARAIYRHQLGPSGCAVGASMAWHGPDLLYSSADGQRAVLDTRTARRISLRPLLRRIPQRGRSQVYDVFWRSALARSPLAPVRGSRGRAVWDGILRVALPSGWSGSVGRGWQGTHRIAWILTGDFRLPAGAARREGGPVVPRSKVLLTIGDFVPAGASAHWPAVKSLRMPHRVIHQGGWWRVRYDRRALVIRVTFGSGSNRRLLTSQVENLLAVVRR